MKLLAVLCIVLFIGCKEEPKSIFSYLPPKQDTLWNRNLRFGFASCNNDICKIAEQKRYEEWSNKYWNDSLKVLVNWIGKMQKIEVLDSGIISFKIKGFTDEVFEGILLQKDSTLLDQFLKLTPTSYVSFSGKWLGDKINYEYANDYEVKKPLFTIVIDSIKPIDYIEKPLP